MDLVRCVALSMVIGYVLLFSMILFLHANDIPSSSGTLSDLRNNNNIVVDDGIYRNDVEQNMNTKTKKVQLRNQQEIDDMLFCAPINHDNCSERSGGLLFIGMLAMPHTASTSTDRFLEQRWRAWNNSLPLNERGFECPKLNMSIHASCVGGRQNYYKKDRISLLPLSPPPYLPENANNTTHHILKCVLEKLRYKNKQHQNYDTLLKRTDVIFTTLRDPAQLVLSHYRHRSVWDGLWEFQYPPQQRHQNVSVSNVNSTNWSMRAWWRHNLFTKMLATESRTIWVNPHRQSPPKWVNVSPTKEQSDLENSLGEKSSWLTSALDRLTTMPFFGLMHRLSESFELMAFHLCLPSTFQHRRNGGPRTVSADLEYVIREHFALDIILLREAEKLFDQRVAEMRVLKQRGYICDLSKTLKQTEGSLGLVCE